MKIALEVPWEELRPVTREQFTRELQEMGTSWVTMYPPRCVLEWDAEKGKYVQRWRQ